MNIKRPYHFSCPMNHYWLILSEILRGKVITSIVFCGLQWLAHVLINAVEDVCCVGLLYHCIFHDVEHVYKSQFAGCAYDTETKSLGFRLVASHFIFNIYITNLFFCMHIMFKIPDLSNGTNTKLAFCELRSFGLRDRLSCWIVLWSVCSWYELQM